jgi:hypothetical protein
MNGMFTSNTLFKVTPPQWVCRKERADESALSRLFQQPISSLLDVEAEVDDIRFFNDVIFPFEPKQSLFLHFRLRPASQ